MQGYGIEKVKQLSIKKGFSNKLFLKPFFMLNEIVDRVLCGLSFLSNPYCTANAIAAGTCYRT